MRGGGVEEERGEESRRRGGSAEQIKAVARRSNQPGQLASPTNTTKHHPPQQNSFIRNFWDGFKEVLGPRHVIQCLEKCDFTPIYDWHAAEREKKKAQTKEDKAAQKAERDAKEAKFKFALVDGRQEQVGNFRVEPPGLFRGRGEHPKMGKVKKRVYPRDITINIGAAACAVLLAWLGSPLACCVLCAVARCCFGDRVGLWRVLLLCLCLDWEERAAARLALNTPPSQPLHHIARRTQTAGKGAPIPEHPYPGQRWKEVRHDNTVTWLAYWRDTVNPKEFK